jgi:DMSO/TMAO reductase YedYZ molybdopterin-dependent catalytic subunit
VIAGSLAALVGVLAVVAAVSIGHLAAGLVAPGSSPVLAVGDTAIDLTPEPVKEFAIRFFGTGDKNALLAGMAVVMLLLAVFAGLVSRRGPIPGLIIVGLCGLVGLAAVGTRPGWQPIWLIAPLCSVAAGVGVFAGLHRLAGNVRTPTADSATVSRRTFLRSSAAVVVAAGGAGIAGQLLSEGSAAAASRAAVARMLPVPSQAPIPPGADFASVGTPTFLTPNSEFYRIDTALSVPRIDAGQWRLRVHGMVDREISLDFADLLRHRVVAKRITMTCVSNDVGGSLISTADFVGVPIRDILLEAGVRAGAQEVLSTSSDGFTAATPLDVLLDPDRAALLAIGMNGAPLPFEHGFPVRMVTPGLYGYVSATKWLVDLNATTFDRIGYWPQRGWSEFGPIKTESRIDRPVDGDQLTAGAVTAAGIAWAQHTGIDRVEVRLDNGPWLEAQLSTEVNSDTWRMWRITLETTPGTHMLTCRATDRSGYTQTAQQAPPTPNGATGWDTVSFTCR